MDTIDGCYGDPLSATNYQLCHLFLVLAVGLLLAAPEPESREEDVIRKQHDAKLDRAELFFRSAKSMCNPVTGFEDADFWSVQALSLMTLYMLAVSKRNTAYAYLGESPWSLRPICVLTVNNRNGCSVCLFSGFAQRRDHA